MGLSFITLLAYDYRYAFAAIRSYYDIADEVILGIDADRLTWAGNPFTLDMTELKHFIARVDQAGKIRVIEGNFHALPLPLDNETAERNTLSLHCAAGNWIVQIDSDEVLMNAKEFQQWMFAGAPADACILAKWVVVFKMFADCALVVDPPGELTTVATMRRGEFVSARRTNQPFVPSPLVLMHYSWGRSEAELLWKLRNWGHSRDFDVDRFFAFWRSIDLSNYEQARNFHPLGDGRAWPRLKRLPLGP